MAGIFPGDRAVKVRIAFGRPGGASLLLLAGSVSFWMAVLL